MSCALTIEKPKAVTVVAAVSISSESLMVRRAALLTQSCSSHCIYDLFGARIANPPGVSPPRRVLTKPTCQEVEMANSRLCSIPDCGKPSYRRGYCISHYWRLRKHGDPLGGGTPNGEPLRFINEVAIQHFGEECLMWPYAKNDKGYGQIRLDKTTYVHRYICMLAHGEPPTPEHEAAHSCGRGNEGCISPHHIRWATDVENEADKLIHGTHNRGARHGHAKLTKTDVLEIISLKGKKSQYAIAASFGVSQQAISNIHNGRNWGSISDNPMPPGEESDG